MICPNCHQANRADSTFCTRCGNALPKDFLQQPYMQDHITSQMPEQPRQSVWLDEREQPSGRRMVPLGVVGFVLGLVGLLSTLVSKLLIDRAENVRHASYEDFLYLYSMSRSERYIITAMYAGAFAMIAFLLGLLAAIFAGKAIGRQHDAPSRWRGNGLYVAGVLLAIAAMGAGFVFFWMGYDLVS